MKNFNARSALTWLFKKIIYLPALIAFKAFFLFLMVCIVLVTFVGLILLAIGFIFYEIFKILDSFYTFSISGSLPDPWQIPGKNISS